MSEQEEPTRRSRAEERLDQLLEVLRSDPPRDDGSLTGSVVRTARWQSAVRAPLRATGLLAAAFVDGVKVLLGRPGGGR